MAEITDKKKGTELPKQTLLLSDRREMKLTGIRDILSFDGESVELDSVLGRIIIDGEGMKIGVLDTEGGNVTLSGSIYAINYRDDGSEKGHGFFKRRG